MRLINEPEIETSQQGRGKWTDSLILVQRALNFLQNFLLGQLDIDFCCTLRERVHFERVLELILVVSIEVKGEVDSDFKETDPAQANKQAEDAAKVTCK